MNLSGEKFDRLKRPIAATALVSIGALGLSACNNEPADGYTCKIERLTPNKETDTLSELAVIALHNTDDNDITQEKIEKVVKDTVFYTNLPSEQISADKEYALWVCE